MERCGLPLMLRTPVSTPHFHAVSYTTLSVCDWYMHKRQSNPGSTTFSQFWIDLHNRRLICFECAGMDLLPASYANGSGFSPANNGAHFANILRVIPSCQVSQ